MYTINQFILEGEFTELKDDVAVMKTTRDVKKENGEYETKEFKFTVVNEVKDGWNFLYDYALPISVRVVGRLEADNHGISTAFLVAENIQVSMKSRYIRAQKEKEAKDGNTECMD